MDPEYFAEEETTERRTLLPMFVSWQDEPTERFEPEAQHADHSPMAKHNWLTDRMMDCYN